MIFYVISPPTSYEKDRPGCTVSIVHNDAELALLGLVDLSEADDVRVNQLLEDLGFLKRGLLLLARHGCQIHLFDHAVLPCIHLLHKKGLPKGAFTELPNAPV